MKEISILAALSILAISGSVAGPGNLESVGALAPATGQTDFVAVGQNPGTQINATNGGSITALEPPAEVRKLMLRGPVGPSKQAALPAPRDAQQGSVSLTPPNQWIRILKDLIRG